MFNMTLGKYFPVASKIHQMNSTNKIICVLLFLTLLYLNDNIYVLGGLTLLVYLMMVLSKVPLSIYFKGLSSLKILIIIIIIINYFMGSNLIDVSMAILKIVLAILYTTMLIYTTSTTEITFGLEQLFSPLQKIGIPVSKLALSIALALRFIPTIFEQAEKILKSQASRGIDYTNSNLQGKLTALTSMLLPMFVLSFRRADNLADAMEVRMYSCANKRTNYRMNKWSKFDDNMIITHVLLLILYIIYRSIL